MLLLSNDEGGSGGDDGRCSVGVEVLPMTSFISCVLLTCSSVEVKTSEVKA